MTLDPSEPAVCDPITLRSAQGYYELGMTQESRDALKSLSRQDRLRAEALELGILLSIEKKDWSKAVSVCERATELHPKLPFGYVNKAYALHESGETESALTVLEDAHLVVAVTATALYNRGCYLACLDRPSEAIFWINKTLRIEPKLGRWAMKDPDLEAIRSELEIDPAGI